MKLWRRFRQAEDGQAAVEFALVLPFLLIMLVGIIEFGRAWNEHQVITDAAREAARRCVVADDAITEDVVIATARNAMAAAGIDSVRRTADHAVTVAETGEQPNVTGETCTIAIEIPYRFTFFGPLVRWATGHSTITLATSFSMRNE